MEPIETAFTPSPCGSGLDTISHIFAWPSSLVLPKAPPKPIWTTKYIFAQNFTTPNDVSTRLVKEIRSHTCSERWRVVIRVIWAVSVILPVLDVLSFLARSIAKYDSAIFAHYEMEASSARVHERERKLKALGDSVREFAGILRVNGCVKEQEEGVEVEELRVLRDDTFRHFSSNISQYQLQLAVHKTSTLVLDLLHECYAFDENDENDPKATIHRSFKAIQTYSEKELNYDWIKGDANEHPLHAAWEHITTHHESFYSLCTSS